MNKLPHGYGYETHEHDPAILRLEEAIDDNLDSVLDKKPLEVSIHHKPIFDSGDAMKSVWPLMSNLVDHSRQNAIKDMLLMPIETSSNFTIPSIDGEARLNHAVLEWSDEDNKVQYRLTNTKALGLVSTVEFEESVIQANKVSPYLTDVLVRAMGVPNTLITTDKIDTDEHFEISNLIYESESTTTVRRHTELLNPYTQISIAQSVAHFHEPYTSINSGSTTHDSVSIRLQHYADSGYTTEQTDESAEDTAKKSSTFHPTVIPSTEEVLRFERDIATGRWIFANAMQADTTPGELPGETEYTDPRFEVPGDKTLHAITDYLENRTSA